jgi:hypothetical protein
MTLSAYAAFKLSVTNKSTMLSVIILNVVMLAPMQPITQNQEKICEFCDEMDS